LGHLELHCVQPLGFGVLAVKMLSALAVPRCFTTAFAPWSRTERAKLGLIHHPNQLLLMPSNALEPLPSRLVKQVVLLGTQRTGDRVISHDGRQRLMRNLPSLPFSLGVVRGTFAVRVVPVQGALMTDNAVMLPNDSIFTIATDAVEHLFVRNELFHFAIVALDQMLDPVGAIGEHVVLVLDALDDAGSTFLLIHEEGPAN
jgi:hypothetical protein